MKKIIVLIGMAMLVSMAVKAQKAEVLYFKANLPCCLAVACNNLEADLRSAVESNFPNGEVIVTTIRLSDQNNKGLVEKFNAKSQTVVVVSKNPENKIVTDVSALVMSYARNNNKEGFEKELIAKISEGVK